jgi:hypothetical protein
MNSQRKKQKICLKEFIPEKSVCVKYPDRQYNVNIIEDENYLTTYYDVDLHNQTGIVGKKRYTLLLPKHIRRGKETFEVLGLLQAEMGKQHDGKVVFCNHEPKLINKAIKWFENELNFPKEKWKWSIKINLNEPTDVEYKKEIEDKVIDYWLKQSELPVENSYPKKVTYIKNTRNKKLKFYDYGTLIFEKKSNLFSQIVKKLVKATFEKILDYEEDEIRAFMRGIIAGESNVEVNPALGHFRIFVSAKELSERKIYQACLLRLGISSSVYPNFHGVVISRKENHLKLLKQKLMTLSLKKYNKFLRMINLYSSFDGLKEWRSNLQKPWNKIPQNQIEKIIELDKEHPDWPAWKIAEQVGVSDIKVQRVRRELAAR